MAITTIGTHGIGTDVIVAADIAANAVTASELADDAVDTDAIADDAVTYAKLQNLGTANRVLGSASTGLIGEVQIATAMIADNAVDGAKIALASQAAGDIMYYNGTDWIRLAKGTADQVLTMNDGATAPGWEAASAGAALSGSTNNTVVTVTGANAMIGEANLTFDGSVLSLASSNNGAANQILIDNDSDTAGSHSQLRLKVQGSSSGDPFIDFTEAGSGQDWSIGIDVSASIFKISRNAELGTNDVISIDDSGKVGIGHSSSVAPLQVHKETAVSSPYGTFAITSRDNLSGANGNFGMVFQQVNASNVVQTTRGKLFFNNQTNSMEMDVHSNGGFTITTPVQIYASVAGASCRIDRTTSIDGTLRDMLLFQRSGTTVGQIKCSNSATSYVTSSDYRLKENVLPITDALDRVALLKPSRFNFIINPDIPQDGFIAHEVSNIVPEAVGGDKDAVDEEGNIIPQGLDYSKIVPLLTAAIQELKAEIDLLKG